MVICLERGADLHMAQLMPLLLTVSCFSKIQIRFTFLVLARPGGPGQRAVKRVCGVCVCVCVCVLPCVTAGLGRALARTRGHGDAQQFAAAVPSRKHRPRRRRPADPAQRPNHGPRRRHRPAQRRPRQVLFRSLAVLDPRVGHTMDVRSPFIHVLCHSD